MKIGEIMPKDREIELNAGKETVQVVVTNKGDRPVQVGSHYHFFEVNRCLSFDREKAYELYFSGKKTSSLEKVVEMECLPEIVNETGKSTNMLYLRGGECPIREVLKEISQSKIF